MGTLKTRLKSHFSTTAAVAAGAVALSAAGSANAAIIYSGVVNLNIPNTTTGLYLNVVTGAYNETGGGGTTVPGWDINPWSSTGFGLFSPGNPSGGAYVVTAPGFGANLAPGAEIGAGSTFGSGTSSNIAQWNLNSSDNLIGFRFFNEESGQVHHGWFRVAFGSSIIQRTLVEYAYESTAGASIMAAAVPAPGVLALLGLGGLAGARRRRA